MSIQGVTDGGVGHDPGTSSQGVRLAFLGRERRHSHVLKLGTARRTSAGRARIPNHPRAGQGPVVPESFGVC